MTIELVRRPIEWLTPVDDTRLEAGDQVVVSAPLASHVRVREALGPEVPDAEARARLRLATVDVVIGRHEAAGRPMQAPARRRGPGPLRERAVSRRRGAAAHDRRRAQGRRRDSGDRRRSAHRGVRQPCRSGDPVVARVGHPHPGHRPAHRRALGAVPVPIFGVRISFGSTAVLVTGIVFGWLKTRRPELGGPISEGGRRMMEDLGLNVFTAVLAINSGRRSTGSSPAARSCRCSSARRSSLRSRRWSRGGSGGTC